MDLAIELDPRHLAAWEARSRCQEHHGRLAEAAGASLDSEEGESQNGPTFQGEFSEL